MTNVPLDSSLDRLFGILEAHNPNLLKLVQAKTVHDFIAVTEGGIELAMKTIENGAKEYAKLSERGLSQLLADCLNHSGWRATAETNNNGHVDVVIEHSSSISLHGVASGLDASRRSDRCRLSVSRSSRV